MRALFSAIGILWILMPSLAMAMSVTPMSLEMSETGNQSRQSITVSNPSSKPIPVEITQYYMDIGIEGEVSAVMPSEDFLIIPAQVIIPPGGLQVFRVQWIGDTEIKESRSYRFNISQVPVKLPTSTSGMQLVMTFGVMVNVAPQNGVSDIVAVDAQAVTDKNGNRVAALLVKNIGNRHGYLKETRVQLTNGDWVAEMTPAEIQRRIGFGVIQPGKERRFILPVEVPEHVSSISASVERQ